MILWITIFSPPPLESQVVIRDSLIIAPSVSKHQRSSSSAAALPPATCVNTEWTIDYSAVKFPRPRITVTTDSITTSVLDCPVAWSGQYSSIVPGYAAALTVQLGSCQADANIPAVEIRDVDEMPGDVVRKEIWFHYGSVPCGGCGLHYQAGLIVTRMNDTPPPPTITLAVEAHNALSSAGPFVVSATDTPSFSVTETHTSGSPCYPATPVIAWQTPTSFRAADFYDAQKDSLVIPASASAYAFYPAGTPDELYILPRAVIDDENGSSSGSALIHLRLKEHCPLVVMSQAEILSNDTATIVTVEVKKKLKYGGITSYPPNTLFTVGIINGQGYGTLMNPAGDTADIFESTAIPLRFVPDTSFHGSLGEVTIRGYEAAEERTTARGTPSTKKAKPDTRPAARLLPPGTCDPDADFRILGLHHLEIILGTDDIAFTESTPMYVIGKTIVNSDYMIKDGTRITVALSGEVDYATFIVGDDTLKTLPAAFELVYSSMPSILPQFAGLFKNHATAANVVIQAHVAGRPSIAGEKTVAVKEQTIRFLTDDNIPRTIHPTIPKKTGHLNSIRLNVGLIRGGEPVAGHPFQVTNNNVDLTGGHTHVTIPRGTSRREKGYAIVGTDTSSFPLFQQTGEDGKKEITYIASEFGDVMLFTVTSTVSSLIQDTISIIERVPGLVLLPDHEDYNKIGGNNAHQNQNSHWCTDSVRINIQSIASEYRQQFPSETKLHINDMSLRWGGLFDVDSNWRLPHTLHRVGKTVDIRTTHLVDSVLIKGVPIPRDHLGLAARNIVGEVIGNKDFENICKKYNGTAKVHSADKRKEHYHVDFK